MSAFCNLDGPAKAVIQSGQGSLNRCKWATVPKYGSFIHMPVAITVARLNHSPELLTILHNRCMLLPNRIRLQERL